MIGGDASAVPFKDFCWQEWLSKYGVKPPWGVKDWANLQRALERFDDPGAAREAWRVYLTNEEPFFKGHSPSKFLLELGRFVRKAPPLVVVTEQIAKMASDRVAIMRAVYTEPEWAGKTELEKRDEYARRVKELAVILLVVFTLGCHSARPCQQDGTCPDAEQSDPTP